MTPAASASPICAVLRPAYVRWRSEHPTVRPSSWVSGIGIALVFSLVTVIASAILHEIALGVVYWDADPAAHETAIAITEAKLF